MTNNELRQLLEDIIQNKDKLDELSKEDLQDILVAFSKIILKHEDMMEKTVAVLKETKPLLDYYDRFLEQELYWQGAFITDR